MKKSSQKIQLILNEEIEKRSLSEKELNQLKECTKSFLLKIKNSLKKLNLDKKIEIFVGGSLAKETLLKKENQDIDIFLRFYKEEDINDPSTFEKIIKNIGEKYTILKGSRNYAQIKIKNEGHNLIFEIIPVLKVKNPKNAKNVTDLSYYHVNYVVKNLNKNKKLREDIILAKAFTHACNCYGAESYIRGFSGYTLELLIIHYKGFLKFIEGISKIDVNKEKIVIDLEKLYKGKNVLYELNESKIESPIVLVDPTFKERNIASSLSKETFFKFTKYCREFLKNPSKEFFEEKKLNGEEFKKNALKDGKEFMSIRIYTDKQAGDIAGTKMLKFSRFLQQKMSEYLNDLELKFDYNHDNQFADIYISANKMKEKIIIGPQVTMLGSLDAFKKVHDKKGNEVFIKNKRAYAKMKLNLSLKQVLDLVKNKYLIAIKEMAINKIEILK